MKQVDESLCNLLVYVDDKSTPVLYRLTKDNKGVVTKQVVKSYSEQDSTDPMVMKEVVNQSFGKYPADSYGLVYWSHDHIADCKKVMNVMGDSVLIADPANDGMVVSDVDITIHIVNGKVVRKQIDGKLSDMCKYPIDEKFMATFTPQYNAIKYFVSKKMGTFTQDISTRSAYFGSSGFMGLIHTVQLQVANAEISLAAPLSFDAKISKGDISVSDMFNLYKYENTLYAMELTVKK